MAGSILIVDDEKDILNLLKRIINEENAYSVEIEANPLNALEMFKKKHYDLVITDLKMPKMSGIKLLEEIKKVRPNASVIVMTAYATIETAVEAIQKGAYDYLTKPFKRERILLSIDKVMQWNAVINENLALRQALAEKGAPASMLGSTPVMMEIFERIRQVAPTTATVLITGASGTGKELIARAVHQHSLRQEKKIITVNCTALPENVIESELFGHVKGAFTDACKNKRGLVEAAHEGTLFLDEIGDLSSGLQAKLLRLLQQGEYKPVGSEITCQSDLRFIAATNHDLKAEIRENRFREDLYYRLNVIHFHLPPLRERKADIPLLSYHFLKKYSRLYQKEVHDISPAAKQALMLHEFPGNVRELENIIERAVILNRTNSLTLKDLALDSAQVSFLPDADQDLLHLSFKKAKDKMIQVFHRHYIQILLTQNAGNISRAAEMAGIQRQYLHRLMKETGIDSEDFKRKPELPKQGENP